MFELQSHMNKIADKERAVCLLCEINTKFSNKSNIASCYGNSSLIPFASFM